MRLFLSAQGGQGCGRCEFPAKPEFFLKISFFRRIVISATDARRFPCYHTSDIPLERRPHMAYMRLGDLLIAAGAITEEQLQTALQT